VALPQTPLGEHPDPLAGFKGPTFKGREGRKNDSKGQRRGRRKGRGPTSKARGGEGKQKRGKDG